MTIFSHIYDNGLVLVAEPMSWVESAAFTFLIPAGSVYDPEDRAGLAGLVCEMTLRGAGNRDTRALVNELDRLGVERGEGVADSHSSLAGAALAANLPDALRIYADILRRPQMPEGQLEAARLVAQHELQSIEDDPHHKVMTELKQRHYPYPWGRPAQGDEAGLAAITMDDIRAQWQQCYRPNGTILGVAGQFEFEPLVEQVGELFGDWNSADEPTVELRENRVRRDHLASDMKQTQIGVAYPSVPYKHPDYFRAWAGVSALSGGMSARLFTEVREKRGLCYSVYASYHTLRDRGAVLCYAGSERAQETLDVMLAELVRLSEGIGPSEIDRLKARAKSTLVMAQESSAARSGALARDWYHLGRSRTLDELGRCVDELTLEGINEYLREHPPGDFTVLTLGRQALEVATD